MNPSIACLPLFLAPLLQDLRERYDKDSWIRAVAQHEEEAELQQGTELRFYDVSGLTGERELRELVTQIVETVDPSQVQVALERLETLGDRRTKVQSVTENLLLAVRDLIEPQLVPPQRVEAVGDGRIALVGGTEQQGWLARFLAAAGEFEGLVSVRAAVYPLPRGKLAELGREESGQILREEEAARLRQALMSGAFAPVTMPELTTYPFQGAKLSVSDQLAYVKDYEIKVLPDQSSEIADPVIDIAESGVNAVLRAVPTPEGAFNLFVDFDYSSLKRPIRSVRTSIGSMGHSVEVQVPEITHFRVFGRFELQPGETLALAATDPAGAGEVLTLLQARRVPAPSESTR